VTSLAPVPETRYLSRLLVGRDDLIALATRRLAEVESGHGHLLFVSGEAGIGKTRLIRQIGRMAEARGFRVATGALAPQDRDAPAAVLLDLARSIARDPELGDLGQTILGSVAGAAAPTMRRRVLIPETVDRLLEGVSKPTLLTFEDLQWADELTLEIVGELTRRTRDLPLLLVASYRNTELDRDSALRGWRSRLLTQRLAEEVRLGRLSREETATVTTDILATGLPAPREVVDVVYARTDGVPLHVEELLAALGDRAFDSAALATAVPETLEDATLERVARLSADAQSIARAGAVLGRSFVLEVLAGILDLPLSALDEPIQQLLDHGILDGPSAGGSYDFRHQLLRDALYRSVPAGDKRRFHGRAAEFGARLEGASVVHASLHYERAGMTQEAFQTALAAAKQAMNMASHREAFDLFRRAVDNMPAGLPDSEKIRLLGICAAAAGTIDRNILSADLAARARDMALRTGDRLGAIEGLSTIAQVARREGESIVKRRDLSRQLLNEIDATPASQDRDIFRVFGLHALALVEYDDCRFGEARALFGEARDIAQGVDPLALADLVHVGHREQRIDNPSLVRWIDDYLAQLDVIEGHVASGLDAICSTGAAARAAGSEDVGANCYRDETLLAMRMLDFRHAGGRLAEGLHYAESVDNAYSVHWLASAEAVLSWGNGRWDEAVRQSRQAVSDPASADSHAMAHWALGYVAAGRGRRTEAEQHLLPALEFARRAERLDMLLPVEWGLAEAALHGGEPADAAVLCDEAVRLGRERGEWALLAPFAVTGVRAYQIAGQPEAAARYLDQLERAVAPIVAVVEPAIRHARGLVQVAEGSIVLARESFQAALRGWEARGRSWEALWAKLDLAAAQLRSRRFGEAVALIDEVRRAAEVLGSGPLLERADQLSRQARGHSAVVEPWHPLTSREFEVARAIAQGMTNAEVAGDLGISPKTVSAHVEHILAKLGATRRAEVAAWASTVMADTGQARETAAVR
jgi:DNA-binding CsgD family transcriptional regulator